MKTRNASFAHYGIPSMRWGVRRFRNYDGTLTEEGKKRYSDSDRDEPKEKPIEPYYSEDALAAMKSRQLGVNALSNDELNRLITREQLEMRYSELQRQKLAQAQAAKGKSFVEKSIDALSTAAKVASAAGTIAESAGKVKKFFDDSNGSSKDSGSSVSEDKKKADSMKTKADLEKSKTEIMRQKAEQKKIKRGGS